MSDTEKSNGGSAALDLLSRERGMASKIRKLLDCQRWVSVGLSMLLHVLAVLGFGAVIVGAFFAVVLLITLAK